MLKMLFERIKNQNTLNVNIFSESPLKTSFYEELQKNEWCNIVNDEPVNLIKLIQKLDFLTDVTGADA